MAAETGLPDALPPELAPAQRIDADGRTMLCTAPPLHRSPMAPRFWPLRWSLSAPFRRSAVDTVDPRDPRPSERIDHWQVGARLRRSFLLIAVLSQTIFGVLAMMSVLPYHGTKPMEIAVLAIFAPLFFWVSAGFWSALAGFALLLMGGDRHAISRRGLQPAPIDPAARTAIVMPICNEDVARVFAGLLATYRSVEKTGELAQFDFFVLSDTGSADLRVAELEAWRRLCAAVGFGRVFYRWRRHRIKRKSGNIADFCRRWGADYRYMVVLDADSIMTGDCLASLVRMMEARPRAGIIQTAPNAIGRDTLYARAQQFASRLYAPLFTAGLCFWQLGESHFWGHNAILRVRPFIDNCALGRLPGRGVWGGEIMSHDFAEAAMMRRAGWGVWIAYDLPGSYEETPPNLVDELTRDRRWCLGNLKNLALFPVERLNSAHRLMFVIGALAYVSAPLWLLFLSITTVMLAQQTLVEPVYFSQPYQLFPEWPQWNPQRAITLFSLTLLLLFTPKVLSFLFALKDGARSFGGRIRLALSIVLETALSMLLAPIRMLFHSQFVVGALAGWASQWKSPAREDSATGWGEAARRHGMHTLFGMAWLAIVFRLNPGSIWWLMPVAGALAISIPVSVFSSHASLGRAMRRLGLFMIPEEVQPPPELGWMRQALAQSAPLPDFRAAVVDPAVSAMVRAAAAGRGRARSQASTRLDGLVYTALVEGPDALTNPQRAALLDDPHALLQLQRALAISAEAHAGWRLDQVEAAQALPAAV